MSEKGEVGSFFIDIVFSLLFLSVAAVIFASHHNVLFTLKRGEAFFSKKKEKFTFSDKISCSEENIKEGFLKKRCCKKETEECAVFIVSLD